MRSVDVSRVTPIGSAKKRPKLPPDRGRLLTAEEVASDIFRGAVTPLWVRRNVPHKVHVSHTIKMWFEDDVLRYANEMREGA